MWDPDCEPDLKRAKDQVLVQTAGAPPQEKAAQPWLAAAGNSLPAA